MKWRVRLTDGAATDLTELYAFLAQNDVTAAEQALRSLRKAFKLLEAFPFSCRKAEGSQATAFLREMVVPFGNAGYVVLFEIQEKGNVTILAVRHQREDDYH